MGLKSKISCKERRVSQLKPVSSPTSACVVEVADGVDFVELDFVAESVGCAVEVEVGSGAQPANANTEIVSTAPAKIAWLRVRTGDLLSFIVRFYV